MSTRHPLVVLLAAMLVLASGPLPARQVPADSAGPSNAPDVQAETQADTWADEWADDGWDDDEWNEDAWQPQAASEWTGFVELAAGSRWNEDPAVGRYATLGEARWRLERSWQWAGGGLDFRGDLLGDAVLSEVDPQLRELAAYWRLGSVDLKAGRQILTWGTGDLLFLNDLFPKGWVSFFIGRDDEYLKAPSDALRLTWYNDWANLDLAAMPFFNPDEYLTGERLSFFSPAADGIVAPEPPLNGREPSASLSNTEWALRLFRNVDGNELALYGYSGFYRQPAPAGPGGALVFPQLDAWGASWRRTLGPGLFNAELSSYHSVDDRAGTNPAILNDQYRFLLGYEWEAVSNLTVGFQYYLEWTRDYDQLLANSPWPDLEVDERRTWLTNRLTWRTRQDRLIWSLFSFYAPGDDDAYLRPQVNWRISDEWLFAAGGNLFFGDQPGTFFAQFEDNSNVYARLRFIY